MSRAPGKVGTETNDSEVKVQRERVSRGLGTKVDGGPMDEDV